MCKTRTTKEKDAGGLKEKDVGRKGKRESVIIMFEFKNILQRNPEAK